MEWSLLASIGCAVLILAWVAVFLLAMLLAGLMAHLPCPRSLEPVQGAVVLAVAVGGFLGACIGLFETCAMVGFFEPMEACVGIILATAGGWGLVTAGRRISEGCRRREQAAQNQKRQQLFQRAFPCHAESGTEDPPTLKSGDAVVERRCRTCGRTEGEAPWMRLPEEEPPAQFVGSEAMQEFVRQLVVNPDLAGLCAACRGERFGELCSEIDRRVERERCSLRGRLRANWQGFAISIVILALIIVVPLVLKELGWLDSWWW